MATVIRFSRHGTKKRPFYRIVVQDHRSPRDGKFIENIGTYDPLKETATNTSVTLKRDRLDYWLGTGAQMSLSVKNHLRSTLKNPANTGLTPPKPKKETRAKA